MGVAGNYVFKSVRLNRHSRQFLLTLLDLEEETRRRALDVYRFKLADWVLILIDLLESRSVNVTEELVMLFLRCGTTNGVDEPP